MSLRKDDTEQHLTLPPHPSPLTLPLSQAHFIWYCAWLSLPSAVYAYAATTTTRHLAIIPAAVWATSLFYWRHPVRKSWRRTLDMTVVFAGVTYQTYYAFRYTSPTQFATYTTLIAASAASYMTSNWLMICGRHWPATYAHASIHFIANVANMVLYSGVGYDDYTVTN